MIHCEHVKFTFSPVRENFGVEDPPVKVVVAGRLVLSMQAAIGTIQQLTDLIQNSG